MSDARNLGETAFVRERGQPSAEIVRVGCAKSRRNCVCGCVANPLRRSCVSDARNLGETAFGPVLRMSRTKRSFWKISLSFFANVSYETLVLQGLFVSFCECLVRNAHFGRFS